MIEVVFDAPIKIDFANLANLLNKDLKPVAYSVNFYNGSWIIAHKDNENSLLATFGQINGSWKGMISFQTDPGGFTISVKSLHPKITKENIQSTLLSKLPSNSPVQQALLSFLEGQPDQKSGQDNQTNIAYEPLRPKLNEIVAMVFQRGYGLAHGPKGNIKYFGTYGAAPCVAIGLVTQKSNEQYPRIAVGHADSLTNLFDAVDNMLLSNNFVGNEGNTKAYIASGDYDPQAIQMTELALLKHGLKPFRDLAQQSSRDLVFDLTTGSPIEKQSYSKLHQYAFTDATMITRIAVISDRSAVMGPLTLDLDMRERIPTKGWGLMLNQHNPLRHLKIRHGL